MYMRDAHWPSAWVDTAEALVREVFERDYVSGRAPVSEVRSIMNLFLIDHLMNSSRRLYRSRLIYNQEIGLTDSNIMLPVLSQPQVSLLMNLRDIFATLRNKLQVLFSGGMNDIKLIPTFHKWHAIT